MDNDPLRRKQRHGVAFERQLPETANRPGRIRSVHPAERHRRLEIDQLTGAAIRDAEHQSRAGLIGRDNRDGAAQHEGRRARKTGEEDARNEGEPHQAGQRFDRDERVGRGAGRRHLAVANGGDRLHGEKDGALPARGQVSAGGAVNRARAGGDVQTGEEQIGGHVEGEHIQIEPWPCHRQHVLVEVEGPPETVAGPHHIQRPIGPHEPRLARLRQAAAEPEVPIVLRVRRVRHDVPYFFSGISTTCTNDPVVRYVFAACWTVAASSRR